MALSFYKIHWQENSVRYTLIVHLRKWRRHCCWPEKRICLNHIIDQHTKFLWFLLFDLKLNLYCSVIRYHSKIHFLLFDTFDPNRPRDKEYKAAVSELWSVSTGHNCSFFTHIKGRSQYYALLHNNKYGHLTKWNNCNAGNTLYKDQSHLVEHLENK